MGITDAIKKRNIAKTRSHYAKKICETKNEMRDSNNSGRLHSLLADIPEVHHINVYRGFMTSVTITMYDGSRFSSSSVFLDRDHALKLLRKVTRYLNEKARKQLDVK